MLQAGTPTVEGRWTRVAEILRPLTKEGHGLLLGAFVHGESFGVTNHVKELKWTAIFFNAAPVTPNGYVMERKCNNHAGLWVQDEGDDRGVAGEERPADHQRCSDDGVIHDGCLVDIKDCPRPLQSSSASRLLEGQGELEGPGRAH